MKRTSKRKYKNRTLTVDFQDEANYRHLYQDGKAFVECVVAFILSPGFQRKHKWGSGRLLSHSSRPLCSDLVRRVGDLASAMHPPQRRVYDLTPFCVAFSVHDARDRRTSRLRDSWRGKFGVDGHGV